MPSSSSFAGNGNPGACAGCVPPDPNGAVGGNASYPYFVEVVNTQISIYNKSTGALSGGYPKSVSYLWSGLTGTRCAADNDGDPIVLYDSAADRWLISQLAITGAPPYQQCIAVSQTADPTGAYYAWAYTWSSTDLNDYPHFGIWPDGYYMTVHNFTGGTTWNGSGVAAFNRTQMIAGNASPQMVQFESLYSVNAPCSNNYGGLLPSTWDGPSLPPTGTPNPFVEVDAADELCSGDPASIKIWNFHVDWTTPANSYFGNASPGSAGAPNQVLSISNFSRECSSTRNCVPQSGTVNGVDALGDRLMYKVHYRNFAGHDAIVFNHTADAGSGIAGIRWYQVYNPTSSAATVNQAATYSPDTNYRWAASIAMDASEDIGMGFSRSSSSTFPSIYYAGRLVSDPLNNMSQGEAAMYTGTGSSTDSTNHRWGDYTSIAVDSSDQCTFWYVNQYFIVNSASAWQTRIGSFKFPSCSACTPPTAPTGVSAVVGGVNQINVSWWTVVGATGYHVYRATTAAGPYFQIASVLSPTTTYSDTTVSGGTTYYYVVRSYVSCESVDSNQASTTATGSCTLAPSFSGVSSVSSSNIANCTLVASWAAATAQCGGPVTYKVYRGTSFPVTPGPLTLVASGISSTSYTDTSVANATSYYYVVRAVDTANSVEDSNVITSVGTTPLGAPVATTLYSKDFESDSGLAGFEVGTFNGGSSADWRGVQSPCTAHSGNHVFRFGGSTACTGNYGNNRYTFAAPGGTSGITIPTGSNTVRLSFWHLWSFQNGSDGGLFYISTDNNNFTYITSAAFVSGAYNGNIGGTPVFTGAQATFTESVINLDTACNLIGGSSGCAGKTIWIAFTGYSNAFTVSTGWTIDDVQITANVPGSCTSGSTVKPVPPNMLASKSGAQVNVSWTATCPDAGYNILWGKASQLSSYTLGGSQCAFSSGSNWSAPDPSALGESFIWWVVVGNDAVSTESSWGTDSSSVERHPTPSGQCSDTAKSPATCP